MSFLIDMVGDSVTRILDGYLSSLMGSGVTIWEPPIGVYGLSETVKTTVIPLILAQNPKPDIVWEAISAWSMRRSPLATSSLYESTLTFKKNRKSGWNRLLNAGIKKIIVSDVVTVGAAQGIADPFRFETDADLFRSATINAVKEIQDDRLEYFNISQVCQDFKVNEVHNRLPDGLHPSQQINGDRGAEGAFILAYQISKRFKEILY
jgi:hypothetical protein